MDHRVHDNDDGTDIERKVSLDVDQVCSTGIDMCPRCGDGHFRGYPCTQKICVISTPKAGSCCDVKPVCPNVGSCWEFDPVLETRTLYLPRNYIFSVRVYENQYLHVKQECLDGTCSCIYYLDGIQSHINPCRLAAVMFISDLWSDSDMWVLTGVCRGFKVVDGQPNISYRVRNYNTILSPEMKEKMQNNLANELIQGKVSIVPEPPTCIHALGAVRRPDGRIRPITDCSRPNTSINDFMWESAPKFKFASIEDTRSMVTKNGFGAVVDISNAYRSILVHPHDRKYLGFTWQTSEGEKWFCDNALCFGLRSAPSIFHSISSFVTRFIEKMGFPVVGYLDDYFVASDTYDSCLENQRYLVKFLEYLGFVINFSKVTPPSPVPKFLGIIIDLQRMVFRLPEEKISKALNSINDMLRSNWSSYKKFEKLVGFLAHCATLVKGGRTFTRRCYSLLKATRGKNRFKISPVVKQDLNWWKAFLRVFDGTVPIKLPPRFAVDLYTDASNSGFGAWSADGFIYGYWGDTPIRCKHMVQPPKFDDVSNSNINVKELWPVVAAIQRWCTQWSHMEVLLHTDNTQVMHMVLSGRSSNLEAMNLLRELFWCCAIHNISLSATHIKTQNNIIADRLSRLPVCLDGYNSYGLPYQFELCCQLPSSSSSSAATR